MSGADLPVDKIGGYYGPNLISSEGRLSGSIPGLETQTVSSSLSSCKIAKVLDRLFETADAQDPPVMARAKAALERLDAPPADSLAKAAIYGEVFMPVSRDVGLLLYILTRNRSPDLIVEFGTSFGISTIHLAAAVRDNGQGRVVSTELHGEKIRRARQNLDDAGLLDLVEIREGDALQTLRTLDGEVGLVLLDGWKDLYLPVLKLLEPRLQPGAIVVADDTSLFPDALQSYLDYVRCPGNGYLSVTIPMGDGVEISQRTV